jgi:hypothetical protein
MTAFRQESVVVDKAPERDQLVEGTGIAVVSNNARESHHGDAYILTGRCLPGS